MATEYNIPERAALPQPSLDLSVSAQPTNDFYNTRFVAIERSDLYYKAELNQKAAKVCHKY